MQTEHCHILPLRRTLHRFLEAEGEVPATITIDSGKPGPKLAIIACTHGNEPVGLAAFEYLLSDLALAKGCLTFIIGNPKAAECYFDAECDDSKQASRYSHANLNRLPEGECWGWRDLRISARRAVEAVAAIYGRGAGCAFHLQRCAADADMCRSAIHRAGAGCAISV